MYRVSLPEYPNFRDGQVLKELELKYKQSGKLKDDESLIQVLENNCYKKGHLKEGESILDIIDQDEQDLKALGLTAKDIWTFHTNIYLLLEYSDLEETDAFSENVYLKEAMNQDTKDYFELPENFGINWCSWGTKEKIINLNNNTYFIARYVWGGAETCPIETLFSSKYHGYSRGDRDYLFINLNTGDKLWVPDLLSAQAGMFGFFQSKSSEYRLDPLKYIEFFNIKESPTLLEYGLKEYWKFCSSSTIKENNFDHKYDESILRVYETDDYIATVFKNDKEEIMLHVYYPNIVDRVTLNIEDKKVSILISNTEYIIGKDIRLLDYTYTESKATSSCIIC